MKVVDQMGRELHLKNIPKRVISLVPSITEYLIDIGVEVVGRTKFCIYPKESVSTIQVIGGTKNFRFEVIDSLEPDLIIGNKEENFEKGINQLSDKFPVWMSDISTLKDSFDMMTRLGEIFDQQKEANHQILEVSKHLLKFKNSKTGNALYLIWADPWMAVGRETFIDDMLGYIGFQNIVKEARYPVLDESQIVKINPEVVLLSSEPFPFKEKHKVLLQSLLPKAEIMDVDGEAYSWYGSRLSKVVF
jgi:ABC-type Fe3+-hydroxamate transport system substrate-binding protein